MLRYAVSLKKDDFIIGDVFALRENEDTYNVGWHFNKRFEGKGFACEAAAGLLDYLFREAGARRIYGFVEDDNIRSKRLCERLGMRREGCFKEFVTFVNNPDGSPKYEDTCVYAILEKEGSVVILGGLSLVNSLHAYTFASLKRKKLISTTPLNDALNALILALNASAAAFVLLFTKKFRILS